MNTNDIFAETPTFTCNEETLTLREIIKTKQIISVTIAYLSKKEEVKVSGIKGIFGFKKSVQNEKEITITDENGIILYCIEGNESAAIRFWDKEEFEKLSDRNYDEDTLWRRYVMTLIAPYQINFHIGNLKKIDWILNQPK